MKSTVFALCGLVFLILLSGISWADCESDCDGPFQTCVKMCRQTTKEDSKEAAACMDNCFRGVSGCQKRCKQKNSGNLEDTKNDRLLIAANNSYTGKSVVQGANCIEQGLTCVLNGTPCCAPYTCKGKFPNTTCQ